MPFLRERHCTIKRISHPARGGVLTHIILKLRKLQKICTCIYAKLTLIRMEPQQTDTGGHAAGRRQ